MKKTFTEKEFKSIINQTRDIFQDTIFETHRMSKELKGLTDSWTCRFDDGKLFEKTGLTTGKTLHFLTTCNN